MNHKDLLDAYNLIGELMVNTIMTNRLSWNLLFRIQIHIENNLKKQIEIESKEYM